jgi:predicted transcriptional regulator
VAVSDLSRVPPERWDTSTVGELVHRDVTRVAQDCDLAEALRLLVREGAAQMLLVTDADGSLGGIVTKTDILRAVGNGGTVPQPRPVISGHLT